MIVPVPGVDAIRGEPVEVPQFAESLGLPCTTTDGKYWVNEVKAYTMPIRDARAIIPRRTRIDHFLTHYSPPRVKGLDPQFTC